MIACDYSGKREIDCHRQNRGSAAQSSSVLDPIDLDEAAGHGRLRIWVDWPDEDETIGAIRASAAAAAGSSAPSSCDTEPASEPAAVTAAADPVFSAKLLVGLRVRMLFGTTGWYLGDVHQVLPNGNLMVHFDDGDSKEYAAAKVRTGLIDKLLFQRVSYPFSVAGTKRAKHYDGTITSHTEGFYVVKYDDGEVKDDYTEEDLRGHLTGVYVDLVGNTHNSTQDLILDGEVDGVMGGAHSGAMDEPESDDLNGEPRRPRRRKVPTKRYEAGAASSTRAEGVRYIVPASRAKRKEHPRQLEAATGGATGGATNGASASGSAIRPINGEQWDDVNAHDQVQTVNVPTVELAEDDQGPELEQQSDEQSDDGGDNVSNEQQGHEHRDEDVSDQQTTLQERGIEDQGSESEQLTEEDQGPESEQEQGQPQEQGQGQEQWDWDDDGTVPVEDADDNLMQQQSDEQPDDGADNGTNPMEQQANEQPADRGVAMPRPLKRPHSRDNRSKQAKKLGWGAPKRRRKKTQPVAVPEQSEQEQEQSEQEQEQAQERSDGENLDEPESEPEPPELETQIAVPARVLGAPTGVLTAIGVPSPRNLHPIQILQLTPVSGSMYDMHIFPGAGSEPWRYPLSALG